MMLRTTKKSILVIDDERDIRMVLNSILSENGYLVTEAYDGQDTITIMIDNKFDFVITDFEMPRITGKDVLE